MHLDLPSQDQPGDREEADMREAFAEALARYISRHYSPHISLRERVRNLSCVSDDELERLVPAVEHFLGLAEGKLRKGQAA
jgi:hypothetical protein